MALSTRPHSSRSGSRHGQHRSYRRRRIRARDLLLLFALADLLIVVACIVAGIAHG